jgi:nitrate/nitrite transport system ATP-binding protein
VPLIEAIGLAKGFPSAAGPRPVLRNINLSVEPGEFLSIVGAMGSGKSTLLGMLAGLVPADAGTITLGGDVVRGIARSAGFVFQNYSLLPWLTALENVRLAVGAACPELSKPEQRARAEAALDMVGLTQAKDRRPRQLSGGMRQRVAIARAFAIEPEILFLDEPFGALDAMTRETLQQELGRLCLSARRPVTVVMITTNVEEAMLLSDRIVPMIPGPPATLGSPIAVTLPRPRVAAAIAQDAEAAQTRTRIIGALAAAVGNRPRRTAAAGQDASRPVALAPAEE